MTEWERIAIDLADRARLPWRFHGRLAFAVLPE
jgi:hypothetical protein